jgi:hypothetical protein
MSSRLAIFIGGVATGIFIDQSYKLPNISKVGNSLGTAIISKVRDLEKKGDNGENNGENKTAENKNEKGFYFPRK